MELWQSQEQFPDVTIASSILGISHQAQKIRRDVVKLGSKNYPVLVCGETGTGKEIVAREIHSNGRSGRPLITVNCSAIPEALFEGQLFGHRKGAFTGAIENKAGFCCAAEDGTLFLDEIEALPMSQQPKLLRLLEANTYIRVGDTKESEFRARVVATTNIDLEEAISRKEFRSDLFYRLNIIPFLLPPLRERKEDIPVLANHFLAHEDKGKHFSPETLAKMMEYSWDGNIRQLKNTIIGAVYRAGDNTEIKPEHLSLCKETFVVDKDMKYIFGFNEFPTFEEFKKSYFKKLLEETKGNKTKMGIISQLDRRGIYRNLEKFKLF